MKFVQLLTNFLIIGLEFKKVLNTFAPITNKNKSLKNLKLLRTGVAALVRTFLPVSCKHLPL